MSTYSSSNNGLGFVVTANGPVTTINPDNGNHVVTVTPKGPRYRWVCKCGSYSYFAAARDVMESSAVDHVLMFRTAVEPESEMPKAPAGTHIRLGGPWDI